jgi:hypothetical protein
MIKDYRKRNNLLSLKHLFKAVSQVTNEINDTMIKDAQKRNNPLSLKPIVQASELYVPGIRDRITKTSEGLDTFKDGSDLDLLNNKRGMGRTLNRKGHIVIRHVPKY